MSNRNAIRHAKKVLGTLTATKIIDLVRSTMADLDKPEIQNNPLIPTADGVWLTTAQVKAEFPDYASNKTVIENVTAVYVGRLAQLMLVSVNFDFKALDREQMADVFSATDAAEKEAIRRMTLN